MAPSIRHLLSFGILWRKCLFYCNLLLPLVTLFQICFNYSLKYTLKWALCNIKRMSKLILKICPFLQISFRNVSFVDINCQNSIRIYEPHNREAVIKFKMLLSTFALLEQLLKSSHSWYQVSKIITVPIVNLIHFHKNYLVLFLFKRSEHWATSLCI